MMQPVKGGVGFWYLGLSTVMSRPARCVGLGERERTLARKGGGLLLLPQLPVLLLSAASAATLAQAGLSQQETN